MTQTLSCSGHSWAQKNETRRHGVSVVSSVPHNLGHHDSLVDTSPDGKLVCLVTYNNWRYPSCANISGSGSTMEIYTLDGEVVLRKSYVGHVRAMQFTPCGRNILTETTEDDGRCFALWSVADGSLVEESRKWTSASGAAGWCLTPSGKLCCAGYDHYCDYYHNFGDDITFGYHDRFDREWSVPVHSVYFGGETWLFDCGKNDVDYEKIQCPTEDTLAIFTHKGKKRRDISLAKEARPPKGSVQPCSCDRNKEICVYDATAETFTHRVPFKAFGEPTYCVSVDMRNVTFTISSGVNGSEVHLDPSLLIAGQCPCAFIRRYDTWYTNTSSTIRNNMFAINFDNKLHVFRFIDDSPF